MTQAAEVLTYNPFEEGFFDDPYGHYRRLRDENPVHLSPFGVYVVARYDDVRAVLVDPALSADDRKAVDNPRREMLKLAGIPLPPEGTLPRIDPPDHKRQRQLVSKAMTPKAITAVEGYVEAQILRAISRMKELGTFDMMEELAFNLPFAVMSELLGVPEEHRKLLKDQAQSCAKSQDVMLTEADVVAAGDATRALTEYLTGVIDEKRRRPADDLLTAMIKAEEVGDRLTTEELVGMSMLFYIAGMDTTAGLIGNGTLALLRNPDQLSALRDGSVDTATAVEELLRFDPSLQMTARVAGPDGYRIGDLTVPPGMMIAPLVGSANRDERRFGNTAAQLDLRRADARDHVGFGWGMHHCLGAFVARQQGGLAFPLLARELPAMSLVEDDPPSFQNTIFFRKPSRLPVHVGS